MRKVVVFQHVAHEILGTLNPLLKQEGFRVRYVNFERDPEIKLSLEKYNGLIVLGGYMGVYEADKYVHIKHELELIEQALKKQIPILGICLGAQLLAHALGSPVRKNHEKEMGWYDLHLTDQGKSSGLLDHFEKSEKIFQMHGDTFDIPKSATHLASTNTCSSQAFSYGEKVFGLQFHLEVDRSMIERWLTNHTPPQDLSDKIIKDTDKYLERSIELSTQTFAKFIKLFGVKDRPVLLGSEHSSSKRR